MATQIRRPTPVIEKLSTIRYDFNKESWHMQVLKVKEIQKLTLGEGAEMCFLDDGIGQNSEIAGRLTYTYHYLETEELEGAHSTFGATLVCGKKLGIFPKLQLKSSQVLDPVSGIGSSASVVSAIYGAKAAGIKCINLSLGMDTPDAAMKKALRDFCSDGVSIATIAAGNDGKKTDYPAGYCSDIPGVISVAATEIRPDGHIRITSFSSWGAITIAAPGHGLKSRNHLDELEFVSGTSFAAPFVGGTIAVMQALRPGITQGEIMAVLHATSKPMAEGAPKAGFGEIDILAIIQRTLDKTPIQPLALPGVKRKWWHKLLG